MLILNIQDYIVKIEIILHDSLKFWRIGPAISSDDTDKIKTRIQRLLLSVYKSNLNLKMVYDRIRPVRSQRPRMNGLPKVNKGNLPLRPILSMVVSVQYQLAQ